MSSGNLALSTPRISAKVALLDAASELFVEKGYSSVSTRELAEAAGVNLGAIQYHFGSKAKLFVATLHRMMEGSSCARAGTSLEGECRSREEAASMLCRFIREFMNFLLRSDGPQPCRLMFREILSDAASDDELSEALVSTFVERFIQPLESGMQRVLEVLSPLSTRDERNSQCRSIIAQCSFYVSHRPFIERLEGTSILESDLFESISDHVCRFSLRGLGCDEQTIQSVLAG